MLRAVDEYAPGVPVLLGVDFGHTDPQYVLPIGGTIRVDPGRRQLVAHY